MWPQTLQMSRDECRGMLRRLELESYSHIVSVFRAQGSLSETKAKLLEELRQVFHITQDRHAAEVRRAANDEQLCTIAENVCGPNTWQEWSREGRRPYPLLPRISPQTALSIVANDLAAKALAENAKLAAPHETGANFSEALREQANYLMLKHHHHNNNKQQEAHVVLEEPFKVPDLPNEIKKATLKRKENESGDSKPNKKRNTQHDNRQQGQQQQSTAQDDDGNATHPVEQHPSPRTMQQRYFYQQQQKHKQRVSSKKAAASAMANHSGNASTAAANTKPAKSGRRRAQKQLQQQQQLQQKQLQEQQQQQQQQHKVLLAATEPTTPSTPTTATQQQPPPNANHLVQPHVEYILDEALKSVAATKLKTLPPAVLQSPTAPAAPRSIVNSPVVFKDNKLSPTPQQQQQQLPQLSTPVKKYIVEERQASPTISTANLPLAPQIISVQQITVPPKVRSTTILPPGTKLTPKKINLLDKQPTLPAVASSPSTTQLRVLGYEPSHHPISNLSNKATTAAAAAATTPTTASVQKYIVEERVPSQTSTSSTATTASPSSSQSPSIATPLSSASAVNIIKNIPVSSLNNTLITPLSTALPVFRKTTAAGAVTTTVAGASGIVASPSTSQLLGNIKLSSSSIKQVPSSALRNIKICSPNGKVFLPAAKLHAGSIIHKLNPNPSNPTATATTVGKATVSVSSAALSPTGHQLATPTSPQPTQQRITIQKMQLLTPTQMTSGSVAKGKPTTLSVSKSNLVFLPTSGMRAVTLASTSKPKTSAAELLTAAKPNVLVIGPASSTTAASSSSQQTVSSILGGKPKANQLITEDTPIDIINMPIIVADNGAAAETAPKTPAKTAPPMVVLNATDWEMELDQASKPSSTVVTPSTTTAATTTTTSTTTATSSTLTNAGSKKLLEALVVEDVREEEVQTAAATQQLNNRIIELQDDDNSAIEYVDMELDQPIEIESSSSITTPAETISSSSSSKVMTVLEEQKKLEVPTVARLTATTTLP